MPRLSQLPSNHCKQAQCSVKSEMHLFSHLEMGKLSRLIFMMCSLLSKGLVFEITTHPSLFYRVKLFSWKENKRHPYPLAFSLASQTQFPHTIIKFFLHTCDTPPRFRFVVTVVEFFSDVKESKLSNYSLLRIRSGI